MNEEQSEALFQLASGIYIQQLRIYDMLGTIAILLAKNDEDKKLVFSLEEMHSNGIVLSSDPSLVLTDDSE